MLDNWVGCGRFLAELQTEPNQNEVAELPRGEAHDSRHGGNHTEGLNQEGPHQSGAWRSIHDQ